jgi:predicted dehydrogenase
MTDMLKASTADLVVLTTPSGLHPGQAIEIAESGRHVMTEKPMATRWHDGLRMVKACDDAGVRMFVVKQNRRNATLQLLKRAVEQKRFGRIYMVNINVFWTRPQEYYDSAKWRGTWEFDGGAFMNQASHYVDLLDWLIGPIESMQAYTATSGSAISRSRIQRRAECPLALRRAGLDERHDADLPEESGGQHHDSRARRAQSASGVLRSTRSSTGISPRRCRKMIKSPPPTMKPHPSMALATRSITTT